MVLTGIEIAALILAVLPVVISAAEHYRDGLRPLKEWKRYPREVDSLYWDLKGQLCLFRNNCEILLRTLCGEDIDASTLADLLNNPEGEGWKSAHLEARLVQVLQESYPIFIHYIEEIWKIVKELEGDLQVAQQQEMPPNDKSKLSKWRAKKWLERIRFTWSKSSRTQLIESLKTKNHLLLELTGGTVPLAKIRLNTDPTHSVILRSMRATASNLYAALESSWCCYCQGSHTANLRLDTRVGGGFRVSHGELRQDQRGSSGFRILFCLDPQTQVNQKLLLRTRRAADIVPWNSGVEQKQNPSFGSAKKVVFAGRSQELMPVDSAKFALGSNQIRSLCHVVREDSKWIDGRSDCLGILLHQSGASYNIYSAQESWMRGLQTSMTLSDILSGESAQGGARHNDRLLCRDRIEVALQLACSVLQLHSSPWLGEQWTSKDIVLLHRSTDASSHLLLETYVKSSFHGARNGVCSEDGTGKGPQTRLGIRNEVLFALGLVLLELAYNRPLAEFRKPEDLGDDGTPNAFTDMSIAARLELTLEREVGPVYATVVRRCLHCTFDVTDTDLKNERFHRAVYTGVVKPLMGILESW